MKREIELSLSFYGHLFPLLHHVIYIVLNIKGIAYSIILFY